MVNPYSRNSVLNCCVCFPKMVTTCFLRPTVPLPWKSVPDRTTTTILDVKCPDSGSSNSFHMDNIDEIKRRISANPRSCELKFVLSSKNDFHWATNFITKHTLNALLPILFSPVQGPCFSAGTGGLAYGD